MRPKLIFFMLLGYLLLGRSFAYIGIQPLKLFIGEVVLAGFLLWQPGLFVGRWIQQTVDGGPLQEFCWAYMVFLAYGLFLAARGINAGFHPVTVLQNLVFNIYPLYFFIGLWAGLENPHLLQRFFRVMGWSTGIYGLFVVLFLSNVYIVMPGTSNVSIFSQGFGYALAILGILAYETKKAHLIPIVALNGFVLLATQIRAEWLGFLTGLFLWSALKGRLSRFVMGIAIVAFVLAVGFLADLRVSGPRGEISTRNIVGRALSPFDQEKAAEFTHNAKVYQGTTDWRKRWWGLIWDSIHSDPTRTLIGFSYGYPISSLAPYIRDESVRTPHNVFFLVLAYGGWFGVVIFFGFQLAVLKELWRVFRVTAQPLGLVYWATCLSSALFGNLFETPFGAIPTYLVLGISAAPLLTAKRSSPLVLNPALPAQTVSQFS